MAEYSSRRVAAVLCICFLLFASQEVKTVEAQFLGLCSHYSSDQGSCSRDDTGDACTVSCGGTVGATIGGTYGRCEGTLGGGKMCTCYSSC